MALPHNKIVNSKNGRLNYNRLLAAFYGILALAAIGTYVMAFVFSLLAFFSPEGIPFANKNYKTLRINILYFWTVSIAVDFKAWQVFLVLNFIFGLSFLSAFFSNERFCGVMKGLFIEGDLNKFRRNFLVLMPGISSAMLLVTTALNTLGESVGAGVGGPSFPDPFSELLTPSYAAVSEEIGFRLVPILIPMAFYLLIETRGSMKGMTNGTKIFMTLTAIFKPESFLQNVKTEPDSWFKILKTLLISISAIMFSFAHVLFGPWSWGKIPSTLIAGLFIGYCSVRYGFDSAILLHWFFNYYWAAISLATRIGVSLINEVTYIVTIYLGLFTILYFVFSSLGRDQTYPQSQNQGRIK
ncbi:MAG: CPBP family glutamic-type intramembrane protease [Candidatus Methanomethylicia archaeon]|nr:CPBP family glutamic-type intramembrane protease [Candidatus Methanomethylicia archaeon]